MNLDKIIQTVIKVFPYLETKDMEYLTTCLEISYELGKLDAATKDINMQNIVSGE